MKTKAMLFVLLLATQAVVAVGVYRGNLAVTILGIASAFSVAVAWPVNLDD